MDKVFRSTNPRRFVTGANASQENYLLASQVESIKNLSKSLEQKDDTDEFFKKVEKRDKIIEDVLKNFKKINLESKNFEDISKESIKFKYEMAKAEKSFSSFLKEGIKENISNAFDITGKIDKLTFGAYSKYISQNERKRDEIKREIETAIQKKINGELLTKKDQSLLKIAEKFEYNVDNISNKFYKEIIKLEKTNERFLKEFIKRNKVTIEEALKNPELVSKKELEKIKETLERTEKRYGEIASINNTNIIDALKERTEPLLEVLKDSFNIQKESLIEEKNRFKKEQERIKRKEAQAKDEKKDNFLKEEEKRKLSEEQVSLLRKLLSKLDPKNLFKANLGKRFGMNDGSSDDDDSSILAWLLGGEVGRRFLGKVLKKTKLGRKILGSKTFNKVMSSNFGKYGLKVLGYGGGTYATAKVGEMAFKHLNSAGQKVGSVTDKVLQKVSNKVADSSIGKAGKKIAEKVTSKILAQGVETGTKSALKKVPLLGALAGAVFAGERLFRGDFKGAGIELMSGLAGAVPGIGTAASVGLDAINLKRDIDNELSETKNEIQPKKYHRRRHGVAYNVESKEAEKGHNKIGKQEKDVLKEVVSIRKILERGTRVNSFKIKEETDTLGKSPEKKEEKSFFKKFKDWFFNPFSTLRRTLGSSTSMGSSVSIPNGSTQVISYGPNRGKSSKYIISDNGKGDLAFKVSARMARKLEGNGRYDVVGDIGDGAGISFGAYQFTEKSGTLKNFVERLAKGNSQYSKEASAFLQNFKGNIYAGDKGKFISWLKKVSSTKEGMSLQDQIWKEKYYDPAMKLALSAGITDPIAIAQIVDHAHNAGLGGAKRMLSKATGKSAVDIANARLVDYQSLKNWNKYGRSWSRRVARIAQMQNVIPSLNNQNIQNTSTASMYANNSSFNSSASIQNTGTSGNGAVDTARSYVGRVKYVWGGKGDPDSGLDCSGFVQMVVRKSFGIKDFPGSTETQLTWCQKHEATGETTPIPFGQHQAGDILWFGGGHGRRVTHVALCSGPDSFIHSSGGSRCKTGNERGCRGVIESRLSTYGRRPNYIYRINKNSVASQETMNPNSAATAISKGLSSALDSGGGGNASNGVSTGSSIQSLASNFSQIGSGIGGSDAVSNIINSVTGGNLGGTLNEISQSLGNSGVSGVLNNILGSGINNVITNLEQELLGNVTSNPIVNSLLDQIVSGRVDMQNNISNALGMLNGGIGSLSDAISNGLSTQSDLPISHDISMADSSLDILRGVLASF